MCVLFDAVITLTGKINTLSIPEQDHVVLLTRFVVFALIDTVILKLLLYKILPVLSLYNEKPPYDASNCFPNLPFKREQAESFPETLRLYQ